MDAYILFKSLKIYSNGDSLKANLIGAAALLTLLLSGCAGAPQSSPTAPSVEPATATATPTATPSPTDAKSPRGNLIKVPGQAASVTDNGETVASFVVKSIKLDPKCTSSSAMKPKNGHFLVLDVAMETTPALAKSVNPEFGISSSYAWKAIAANGTTFNGDLGTFEAVMCMNDAERFPSTLGPAEKATGKIVLDVPTTTGVVVHKQGFMSAGWEWSYPAK
ncbi:DUF4352 domain-containing protein [Arthrobacter sp. IA7]|uniref:hypothetical protein n=1 Tax=Arthrobacter ipis TaxID=2716202 RepID=UPI0016858676|nr:hypothetical protein [Arthrobacter ipis]MBD1543911.1 DUF4352 domain-containing protein [Arthrobacter ipis]